jgi:pre-mRNA cleavage complex 2 protein Pcf11
MGAYLVVDPPIRRKLEEMLQTWKQPVPGSTSSAPVFGPEITRKIDNALIKARTAALEQQQKQKKHRQDMGLDARPPTRTPPPQQFRNTPPMPQANGNVPFTNGSDYGRSATGTPLGQNPAPVGVTALHDFLRVLTYARQPIVDTAAAAGLRQLSIQTPPQPVGGNGNVDTLQSDIFRLIDSCQTAVAREPLNQELQKRLQALVDLRNILQTQQLPEAQLVLIRDQVRALANPTPPPPVVAPPPPLQPPPPQMPPLPLSTQDLASLLATVPFPPNIAQQPQRPPLSMSLPTGPIIHPPSVPAPPPAPAANFGGNGMDPAALFASLQKAGLLPPPPPPPPVGGPLPFPLPMLPRNMMTPPTQAATPVANAAGSKWDWSTVDVEMKSLSLKM